jgi:hypothetical protein
MARGRRPSHLLLEERAARSDGGGPSQRSLSVEFELPFKRSDVFAELMAPKAPLGLSSGSVTLKLLKPGRVP